MFNFGISEFDPLDGSATSIDPLRSLAFSVRLGDMLFPGSSGRIWRLRYLSALSYLLKLSNPDPTKDFRTNYINFRKYENAFLLVTCVLSEKYKEKFSTKNIIGTTKSKSYIQQNKGRVAIAGGDLLANQMNLGPIGIHGVLMKDESFSLFDGENLEMLPNGIDLADMYQKSLGEDHERFFSLVGSKNRVNLKIEDIEDFGSGFLFELNVKGKANERKLIEEMLLKNPDRKQFVDDLKSLESKHDEINEFMLINLLISLDSPNKPKYDLVKAFDGMQKSLMYFFDHLRAVTKETITYDAVKDSRINTVYEEICNDLKTKSEDLIIKADAFRSDIEDHRDTADSIKEFAEDISMSLNSKSEFINYLISFHEKHQRKKGKAAWIKLKSETHIEIHPSNYIDKPISSYKDYTNWNLHNYRCQNVVAMIRDMKKAA